MSSLVSVILATYNGARHVNAQIRSILDQTYQKIEVIWADDASSDGTWEEAQRLAGLDGRLRVFRQARNVGLVRNFLDAASRCRGDFVCFSDQDDIWHPGKIETLLRILYRKPSAMLAYSDLEVCDEALKPIGISFWAANRIRPFNGSPGALSLLKNIAPGCSMMFRKSVNNLLSALSRDEHFVRINAVKSLEEVPVMHDHLAWIIASGTGEVAFSRHRLVDYRQHGDSSIGAFHRAPHSRERFVRLLESRIIALTTIRAEMPRIDWDGLQRFLDGYRCEMRGPMPAELPYFMGMRGGAGADRLLAALDCLAPSVYRKLKGVKRDLGRRMRQ